MDPLWHAHYPAGVPREIDLSRYPSLTALIEGACSRYAGLPAFAQMGHELTYAELWEASGRFAAFLTGESGLRRGDAIAIQLPNLLQYPVALFGALRAGLVVVNTNPLYTPREMQHQFRDSGVKAIVLLENFADKLEEILAETQIRSVILTGIGDLLPTPRRQLVNFAVRHVKRMVPKHGLKHVGFREALARGTASRFDPPAIGPEDTAFLQYTGGTTGVSKGAILTHGNMTANIQQIAEWMKPRLESGRETVMTPLPLYHVFALTVNCMAFVTVGARIVLVANPRDIPGFIRELEKTQPTAMSVVNTLALALINHPGFGKLKLKRLKITVAGGMALQGSVARRWAEITGTPIAEGYGLTEASPVVTCNPIDGTARAGTIGLPLPSTEIRILDESGGEAPVGQPGELHVRGPQVMKGYWNQPEESAKVLTPDGWLRTGDIATADADGYLKIVDRKKDMILVSGFNVYPNEIEEVMTNHPGILEAAAVGIEDARSGEAVKLFVVPRDSGLTAAAIQEYARKYLAAYKIPRQVEFLPALPKNNVGKILRRELRGR